MLVGSLESVPASTCIVIVSIAWFLFTCGLYLHRWLSKLAGHPIGPSPTVKHLP